MKRITWVVRVRSAAGHVLLSERFRDAVSAWDQALRWRKECPDDIIEHEQETTEE